MRKEAGGLVGEPGPAAAGSSLAGVVVSTPRGDLRDPSLGPAQNADALPPQGASGEVVVGELGPPMAGHVGLCRP